MARPSNTEARRAQIAQGLERLLPTTGYERATIAAIAEAAGLTAGLVHYHFDSKQAILIEVVRDLQRRLARRCDEAVRQAGMSPGRPGRKTGSGATGSSPRARLEAWLDAHVALGPGADPLAVACWVAIAGEATRQPEVHQVYLQALQAEAAALHELLAAVVPGHSVEPIAAGLLSAIQGAYLLGTVAPSVVPKGFARAAVQAMLRGLLDHEA